MIRSRRFHAGVRDVAAGRHGSDVVAALAMIRRKADEHIEGDVEYPGVLAGLADITVERLTRPETHDG